MARRRARARGKLMSKKSNAGLTDTQYFARLAPKTPKRIKPAENQREQPPSATRELDKFKGLGEIERAGFAFERRLSSYDLTRLTLGAYSVPSAFESQQQSNGHLTAQARILGLLRRFIGSNVVSLASGTGWLDRKLVYQKEKELYHGGTLRLLGIDLTPENITCAYEGMNSLIKKSPVIRRATEEGRFRFQYVLASLGPEKYIADSKGTRVPVPGFSSINLEDTVIGSKTADTFIVFMAFVLWVHEREEAIQSIAEKSHRAGNGKPPTYVINGEEYPTHLTPNAFLRDDFVSAVRMNLAHEVSTDELWGTLFPRAGFRMMPGARGKENLGHTSENHHLQYCALRYEGGSNPFGFKKIQ